MSSTTYWTLEQKDVTSPYDGKEKTFEQWGFSRLRRTRATQGTSQTYDSVTFERASSATAMTDDDVLEPYRDVIIRERRVMATDGSFSGGARWFFGRVIGTPKTGVENHESGTYKIAGPWWFLETKLYQQVWNLYGGIVGKDPVPTEEYIIVHGADSTQDYYLIVKHLTHLVLNQNITGQANSYNKISTGQQIVDALNWCLSPWRNNDGSLQADAPFQLGSEFPAYDPLQPLANPIRSAMAEQKGCPNFDIAIDTGFEITCAEVVTRMLRWSQNAVTWFDYTTDPPTIHCKQKTGVYFTFAGDVPTFHVSPTHALDVVDISMASDSTDGDIKHLSVEPRYDLLVPKVTINFEQTGTFNGQQYRVVNPLNTQTAWDVAEFGPDGPDPKHRFGEMVATLSLFGANVGSSTANLQTVEIKPVDLGFWGEYVPWLNTGGKWNQGSGTDAGPIENVTLQNPKRSTKRTTPYTRAVAPHSSGIAPWMGVPYELETMSVEAIVKYASGAAETKLITHNFVSTDQESKTFSTSSVQTPAEPVPVGIAQAMFATLGDLLYSGSITLEQDECDGRLHPGVMLNVLGGNAAWATMNAIVTKTDEDVDSGTTTASFGMPAHMGVTDLIELMRISRTRERGPMMEVMFRTGSSLSGSGADSGLADITPIENSTSTMIHNPIAVMSDPTNGPASNYIAHNSNAQPSGSSVGKKAKLIASGGGTGNVVSTWSSDQFKFPAGSTNAWQIIASIDMSKLLPLLGKVDAQGQHFAVGFNEWDVCVEDPPSSGNFVKKKAMFWSSLPYNPPTP